MPFPLGWRNQVLFEQQLINIEIFSDLPQYYFKMKYIINFEKLLKISNKTENSMRMFGEKNISKPATTTIFVISQVSHYSECQSA